MCIFLGQHGLFRVRGPPVFHYKTDVGYLNRLIRLYHRRFYYLTMKVGSENENNHGRLETDRDNQIKKYRKATVIT
jgi:hypothetical protein